MARFEHVLAPDTTIHDPGARFELIGSIRAICYIIIYHDIPEWFVELRRYILDLEIQSDVASASTKDVGPTYTSLPSPIFGPFYALFSVEIVCAVKGKDNWYQPTHSYSCSLKSRGSSSNVEGEAPNHIGESSRA
jgi:hypothetical protein